MLEEVQKLKEHCLVKQEQFYFMKQFIIEKLGTESDDISRSHSPRYSPRRLSTTEPNPETEDKEDERP